MQSTGERVDSRQMLVVGDARVSGACQESYNSLRAFDIGFLGWNQVRDLGYLPVVRQKQNVPNAVQMSIATFRRLIN